MAERDGVNVLDTVAKLVPVIVIEFVGDGVLVPLGVIVDEGVGVGDEEGVENALAVIEGEAPDDKLAVGVIEMEPETVVEPLGVPDTVFEGD